MILCKTQIDKKSIKALAKYHLSRQRVSKTKLLFTYVLTFFLILLSTLNAYGIWKKYCLTESVFTILLKSSILFIFSAIIILTSIKGPEHNLYLELKQYFTKTNTTCLDYTISVDGIQLKTNAQTTTYRWESIEQIHADKNYYYFTSEGKHSLIDKNSISPEDRTILENMMKMKK